jgi:glycosyltransferase involved in cell wall biosynthesis
MRENRQIDRRTLFPVERRLGYLSAAPRVSTRSDAEHGGARAHVLGVMQAFESLGWRVRPFIVGDRVPQSWNRKGSESVIRGGGIRTLAADLMRLGMGNLNAHRAWRELGSRVDWVYERNASLQSLGGIFKRHDIPWILETNAPLFYEAKRERGTVVLGSLARRLEVKAYRECDVLVCITETLRDILVREAGISREKIVVMHNGVDVAFFDPSRYRPKRVFDDLVIGFVGKLSEWQGVGLLLEALSELRRDGLRLNLVVVGDGAARTDLEKQVEALGLGDRVEFVGRVPRHDVPGYIAGFDLGYSGQMRLPIGVMYRSPLKLYEYMAMARPVIASNFDEAQTLIREGETGYLFELGSKDSLKEKLTLAYENSSQLIGMGYRAREEIVSEHSWTARVSGLVSAVEWILGTR